MNTRCPSVLVESVFRLFDLGCDSGTGRVSNESMDTLARLGLPRIGGTPLHFTVGF